MSGLEDIAVVTGGEGYLASQLIKQLLERGYTVHATVLTCDEKSTSHLKALTSALPGKLVLFEANSLVPGSFDPAVEHAKYVFHVASPVIFGSGIPEEDQRNIVDVAVSGATNIIRAAARSKTVERVIYTSSIAAMHTNQDNGSRDRVSPPCNGSLYTEQDWNNDCSLETSAYPYSKVQAERAAWRTAEELGVDLVVILPATICGPPIRRAFGYSPNALKVKPGCHKPRLGVQELPHLHTCKGFWVQRIHLEGASWDQMKVEAHIDVRDCAHAHIRAAETPAAHGRYFISHETRTDVRKVSAALKASFPQLPIASAAEGVSYWKYNNSKVERDLGLSDKSYIPIPTSFVDQARAMLAMDMVDLKN